MTSPELLVVDASVAVKWALEEPGSLQARRLLARASSGGTRLLAPDILVGECTNAIWKNARLRRAVEEATARDALAMLLGLLPVLTPARELAAQAFELALDFRQPVYDCMYVALALREGCTLVTADARLVRVMGSTGRVTHIEDF